MYELLRWCCAIVDRSAYTAKRGWGIDLAGPANDRFAVCLDNTVAKRESSCVVCFATVKPAGNFGRLVRLDIQGGQLCIEVLQRLLFTY